MSTKTYIIREIYGEDFDATIYTNGGTYHKVEIINIDDGSRTVHKFYNRAKAFKFAQEKIS